MNHETAKQADDEDDAQAIYQVAAGHGLDPRPSREVAWAETSLVHLPYRKRESIHPSIVGDVLPDAPRASAMRHLAIIALLLGGCSTPDFLVGLKGSELRANMIPT